MQLFLIFIFLLCNYRIVYTQEEEWTPVVDKASGSTYYWNKATGKTTAVGAPNPSKRENSLPTAPSTVALKTAVVVPIKAAAIEEEWSPVVDKASGGTYYWNKKTGKTTAIGAPKPSASLGTVILSPAPSMPPIANPSMVPIPASVSLPLSPAKEMSKIWTPVLDKASGKIYYWNKKNGETTRPGDALPITETLVSTATPTITTTNTAAVVVTSAPSASAVAVAPLAVAAATTITPSAQVIESKSVEPVATTLPAVPVSWVLDDADVWTPVSDKSSGKIYWWNKKTGVTTAVGADKPSSASAKAQANEKKIEANIEAWTEVIDKANGKSYWWNKQTGETTAVGASKPKSSLEALASPAGTTVTMTDKSEKVKFERIIKWPELFTEFLKVKSKRQKGFFASFPGVEAHSIPCPPIRTCDLNYTFQPQTIQQQGGICGVDFIASVYNGEKTRIFLLPQLQESDTNGPRGIIATSTGLVFDLSGGCQGCIDVEPKIGMEFTINQVIRGVPVLVAGLHSHSTTYVHTVGEIIPRLFLVIDYIRAKFNLDPDYLMIQITSPMAIMNSVNEMLTWGLTPTYRDYTKRAWVGSFVTPDSHDVVEGTERIIIPIEQSKSFYPLLSSARKCVINKLKIYIPKHNELKCAAIDLPSKYILLVPRAGEKQRVLLNSTALRNYLDKAFDIPVIAPDLKYGCNLADNIRFFKNALGFISPHGAAFTNQNFIEQKFAVIFQIIPNIPNPFTENIQTFMNIGNKMGHSAYVIPTISTGSPRWDLEFNYDVFNKVICVKQTNGNLTMPSLDVLLPTRWLQNECMDYLRRLKS